MLDTLGFEKQHDCHSCGAYVIAGFVSFAASTKQLPQRTFVDGYDNNLTDQSRWMSANNYVLNTELASEKNRSGSVSEGGIAVFQYENWNDRLAL